MRDRGGPMKTTKMLAGEAGPIPAPLMQADDEIGAPTQEAIARLAYSYWEARGGQGGSPWEDWFQAEEELKRRQEL
jgi:hypothetical protein